ncbi:hypothetical protein [Brevundimonas sp. Root1279]|uniref:hypothetical protein n=1 Tax=Brevundimonas sp. Root1279 TaxID=1736443 RepID=UPI0006FD2DCB|nr:hypothetical protein [Brevundimonas sp. Root1279]KQW82272.1 hypothetical protein ASC65_08335 [Brevundimonas sp. Root1279]
MRRFAKLGAILAFAVTASGCAWVQQTTQPVLAQLNQLTKVEEPSAGDLPGQIEPVHAAAIAQNEAVFWVSSNGCTAKADLTPIIRRGGDGAVISLRRIKEDLCRDPKPEGVEMRWTFQEMGLEPGARVSVENPYQMPRG